LVGGKIIAYPAFKKVAEVSYDPDNINAVDINEDNVTVAMLLKEVLGGL